MRRVRATLLSADADVSVRRLPGGQPRAGRAEGVVYSWITVNRALHPAFVADVPYVIATVDLADGARMFGRLFIDSGDVTAGMPVEVHFYTAGGWRLVGFKAETEPAR